MTPPTLTARERWLIAWVHAEFITGAHEVSEKIIADRLSRPCGELAITIGSALRKMAPPAPSLLTAEQKAALESIIVTRVIPRSAHLKPLVIHELKADDIGQVTHNWDTCRTIVQQVGMDPKHTQGYVNRAAWLLAADARIKAGA